MARASEQFTPDDVRMTKPSNHRQRLMRGRRVRVSGAIRCTTSAPCRIVASHVPWHACSAREVVREDRPMKFTYMTGFTASLTWIAPTLWIVHVSEQFTPELSATRC